MARLPKRQAELLERVCLRRYEVLFEHYMGTFRPNESVRVTDSAAGDDLGEKVDRSFRASTAEALRARGLVRYRSAGTMGYSVLKPTRAGLERFRAERRR